MRHRLSYRWTAHARRVRRTRAESAAHPLSISLRGSSAPEPKEEEKEVSVVLQPDAVVHPGAMVVHLQHAALANTAVVRQPWLGPAALLAPPRPRCAAGAGEWASLSINLPGGRDRQAALEQQARAGARAVERRGL